MSSQQPSVPPSGRPGPEPVSGSGPWGDQDRAAKVAVVVLGAVFGAAVVVAVVLGVVLGG
ncbi:hypothetical protein ACIBK8_13575 [Streptomyces sp. NPDC050161]|uniref:hypothetical protein n=1 Tax=Streptomyces sp. NPDC050161 TaxID=3365604 RepID=UPI0037B8EEEB